MGTQDQELLTRLLATFRVEAQEHIQAMSNGLVELEKEASPERQKEIIETVFREAHSLKGAARAVNLTKVETICQSLESSFSKLKTRAVTLSPELFDGLHQMVSNAAAEASVDESQPSTAAEQASAALHGLITQLAAIPPQVPSGVPTVSAPVRNTPDERSGLDTVRVSTSKLDSLLRQAEELISTKITGAHRVAQLKEVTATLTRWEKEWNKVRPHVRAVRRSVETEDGANGHIAASNGQAKTKGMNNILTFLEWNEGTLQSIRGQLASIASDLEIDYRTLERKASDLLEDAKRVSMVPFSSLLGVFPKLVRDLCRDCGKDAELTVEGGDIEADRRILEEMKDPLIHLVRNCIDHGIEPPNERTRIGKPQRATIAVAICPKSSEKVEIVVSDDGAGIDGKRVSAAAIRMGLVSQDDAQKMDDRQATSLIFQSGLSTSPIITEVSGRGLGLAIVREKAEQIGGDVVVESRRGVGTTFRLLLPLTLATFRGIVVRVEEKLFVVPSMYVQRVLRVGWDEIRTVENRETIQVSGRALSLARLRDVLQLGATRPAPDRKRKLSVLVLVWAGEQLSFVVDEILNEQEVLVKGLGKQLRRVRNVAGATILGSGKVAPVLNVADLFRSAVSTTAVNPAPQDEAKPKSILVAEDSITARTLLKSILESAGYRVKTAVDGAEAFATLGTEEFDLVVSDVEMPRMNGFDLTAKIRSDRKLSELPVVLVTALQSRQDRERGIDVGASAYIVKSSFDQSDLLDVVGRLI
jgi:two-component system, chemotaxis family, sensor kinase CheA